MDEVNIRVQRVIEKVALSKSDFSAKTGISPVIISHISSGRNKVSLAAIQQILQAYPEINPEYLIMGKGSMFLEKNDESKKQIRAELETLRTTISSFHEQMERHIRSLIRKIENE